MSIIGPLFAFFPVWPATVPGRFISLPVMDASFQPQVLDPHAATPQPVQPANGRCFELAELYRLLDCSTVEVVTLTDELILIIDEESKFRSPAYLNLLATYLWHSHQPAARGVDCIVGRALYCHTRQFE